MSDTLTLSLDIQNSLLKNLEENTKTMKSFNSLLDKSRDQMEKMANSTKTAGIQSDKLRDSFDDITVKQKESVKTQKGFNDLLSKGLSIVKTLFGFFGSLKLGGVLLDVIRINQEMKDLSMQMGRGAKSSYLLAEGVNKVTLATGASLDASEKFIKSLAMYRVSDKDIIQLAIHTQRFSEITGITADQASDLAGQLSQVGKFSEEASASLMAGMARMQRYYGLASAAMGEVVDTALQATMILKQWGKSTSDIERFNVGTTKLAAQFEKIGLKAKDALSIVEKLLDPGAIEENAMLYAKLGISISDVIQGNIDPGTLTEKMRGLGQELKNMSGPAAAAMARSLNLPLQQLRQMAELKEDIGPQKQVVDAGEELRKMAEEQKGMQRNMETIINQTAGLIASVFQKAMPFLDKLSRNIKDLFGQGVRYIDKIVSRIGDVIKIITNPVTWVVVGATLLGAALLFRKKMYETNLETSVSLQKGIEGALEMGAEKGSIKAKQKLSGFKEAMIGKESPLSASLNPKQSEFLQKSFFMQSKSLETSSKHAKNIYESMALHYKVISETVKKYGAYGGLADSIGQKILQRGKEQDQQNTIRVGLFQEQINLGEQRLNQVKEELTNLEKVDNKSAEQLWRVRKLQDMETRYQNQVNDAINRQSALQKKIDDDRVKLLGKITDVQLDSERRIAKERMITLESDIAGRETNINIIEREKDLQERLLSQTNKEIEGFQNKGELTKDQAKQLDILLERQRRINAAQDQTNKKLSEERELKERTLKLAEDLRKEQGRINDELKKRDLSENSLAGAKMARSIWTRMNDNIKMIFKYGEDAVVGAGNKIRDIGNAVADSIKGKASTILDSIREKGNGNIALGVGKYAAKGLGVALGGAAIGGIGLLLDKLMGIEPIKNALDSISRILGTVFAPLIKIVEPIVEPFMKLFITVAKTVLPPMIWIGGKLVESIGLVVQGIGKLSGNSGLFNFGKEINNAGKEMGILSGKIGTMIDQAVEKERIEKERSKENAIVENNLNKNLQKLGAAQLDSISIQSLAIAGQDVGMTNLRTALEISAQEVRNNTRALITKKIIDEGYGLKIEQEMKKPFSDVNEAKESFKNILGKIDSNLGQDDISNKLFNDFYESRKIKTNVPSSQKKSEFATLSDISNQQLIDIYNGKTSLNVERSDGIAKGAFDYSKTIGGIKGFVDRFFDKEIINNPSIRRDFGNESSTSLLRNAFNSIFNSGDEKNIGKKYTITERIPEKIAEKFILTPKLQGANFLNDALINLLSPAASDEKLEDIYKGVYVKGGFDYPAIDAAIKELKSNYNLDIPGYNPVGGSLPTDSNNNPIINSGTSPTIYGIKDDNKLIKEKEEQKEAEKKSQETQEKLVSRLDSLETTQDVTNKVLMDLNTTLSELAKKLGLVLSSTAAG